MASLLRQNRKLHKENEDWIEDWKTQLSDLPASNQKLEWNDKAGSRDIFDHVLQFRPSGIRVSKTTHSPSLVAMTETQVPIIGWKKDISRHANALRFKVWTN